MKRMLWMISATLTVAGLSPLLAQDAQPNSKEEKKICRSQGMKTGSIFGAKRVCHTKEEWVQIEDANERNTERALEARRASSASGAR